MTIEGKKKLSVKKRTIDMATKGSLGHVKGNETIDDYHTDIVMSTKSLIDQGNLLEKSRRASEPVEKCKRHVIFTDFVAFNFNGNIKFRILYN